MRLEQAVYEMQKNHMICKADNFAFSVKYNKSCNIFEWCTDSGESIKCSFGDYKPVFFSPNLFTADWRIIKFIESKE